MTHRIQFSPTLVHIWSTRDGNGSDPEPVLNHVLRHPAQEPEGARQGKARPTPDRGAPSPATKTPQSRSVLRLSVHGADINGPDVNTPSGDR